VPSFDIVSEWTTASCQCHTQARKELATRFDFKNSPRRSTKPRPFSSARRADASKLAGLLEIVVGKLAKRNIDLRISTAGARHLLHGPATQELPHQAGPRGEKAKEIIKAEGCRAQGPCSPGPPIRVTGKKKDDLQAVIQFLRSQDFGVSLGFKNFRE